jgi:osmotically-inducible protein OsmY
VALQNNSETSHLADLHVRVRNVIAYVRGLVESEDDIARVADVVVYLNGVRDVVMDLEVA